jgi:hypothetical protein
MNTYNVHIYREMRLDFVGIEADTPATAAEIAARRQTEEADNIEDCQGDNLSALVDVAGDEDYRHSVLIDFEAERQRKAATALLASLQAIVPYAENEGRSLAECWKRDGEAAARIEAGRCEQAVEAARVAIDRATDVISSRGPVAASRFEIDLAPDSPDHIYVEVDHRFNVAIERTESGLEFRIYPRTAGELWNDPFTTFEVDESEIIELEKEIGL